MDGGHTLVSGISETASDWVVRIAIGVVVTAGAAGVAFFSGGVGQAAGKWKSKFQSDDAEHSEEIRCQQFFNLVRGSSTVRWKSFGVDGKTTEAERKFKFSGVISHDFLRATYWCTEPGIVDYGTFLLKRKHAGGFSGSYIGLEGDADARIETVSSYEWASAR